MEIKNEILKDIMDLKIIEFKYKVLTAYIKLEAKKELFFDKEKIVKLIDVLEQKEIEEKIENEKGGNENE